MNFEEIKELLEKFDASELREFLWKNSTDTIQMSKNKNRPLPAADEPLSPEKEAAPAETAAVEAPEAQEVPTHSADWTELHSPLVGVAYLRPEPEAPQFKEVGDSVEKGDILCIIEAMKVMNEIPCPVSGILKEINIENEAVVEYDQLLFRIEGEENA
ncbi:acetyl-CoA carboxylase biotin carboxyl carrier protein [Enterococcus hirae]|nr:acetyl-CoA carboxylase biotin carboxyl carrier protein [Enterococcus hirae]